MDTKNKEIKLKGIIIGEKNYNEYDKVLTLLTDELGKINVYAFSVRRVNSKNLAKTRMFTFGNFTLKKIKDSYQYSECDVKKYFTELVEDYDIYQISLYFIEIINYFTVENLNEKEYLRLLVYALNELIKKNINIKLIKVIFELKVLVIEGIYDVLNKKDTQISDTILYVYNMICVKNEKDLWNFNLTSKYIDELSEIVKKQYKNKINKKFKLEKNI